MFSKAFWQATFERAVRTFAQSLVAIIGVSAVAPADIDWKQALAVGGVGALLSVLTSVAAAGIGNPGPSLANEEVVPSPPADGGPFVHPEV